MVYRYTLSSTMKIVIMTLNFLILMQRPFWNRISQYTKRTISPKLIISGQEWNTLPDSKKNHKKTTGRFFSLFLSLIAVLSLNQKNWSYPKSPALCTNLRHFIRSMELLQKLATMYRPTVLEEWNLSLKGYFLICTREW